MKNCFLRIGVGVQLAVMGMVADMLGATLAIAAYDDMKEMSENVQETFQSFGGLAAYCFFFLGFCMAGWGIYLLAQNVRNGGQDGGKMRSLLFVVCGVLLMGILGFSDTMSGTLTGGNAQGLEQLGMN